MRHGNSGRKFDRNTSARRAMFRNLAANLVLHEAIETTDAKAKEVRRVVEKLITKAKRLGEVAYTPNDKLSDQQRANRMSVERQISAYLPRIVTRTNTGGTFEKVDIVEKMFVDLAKRFATRPGGYTRIIKVALRRGDNAPLSKIEFVDAGVPYVKPAKTEKKEKAPKEAKAPKAAKPAKAAAAPAKKTAKKAAAK